MALPHRPTDFLKFFQTRAHLQLQKSLGGPAPLNGLAHIGEEGAAPHSFEIEPRGGNRVFRQPAQGAIACLNRGGKSSQNQAAAAGQKQKGAHGVFPRVRAGFTT